MSTIGERQNLLLNLEKLAAQKTLYSQAKIWLGISIIISMPLVVLVTVYALFFNNSQTNYDWLVVLVSFLVLLVNDLLLMPIVENKKELASRIQESYDCDVLGLPWNYIVGSVPEPTVIHRYSRKLLQNPEQKKKLVNWYDANIDSVPEDAGKIICQRSNILWDKGLRKLYQSGIIILGLLMIAILISIGIFQSMNFEEWIIYLLAPGAPVFSTLIQHWRMQKGSIETLKQMHEKTNAEWKNYLQTFDQSCLNSRQIQDEIYIHRRINMPIFDWFYNCNRDCQEEEQSYLADYYIRKYQQVLIKRKKQIG